MLVEEKSITDPARRALSRKIRRKEKIFRAGCNLRRIFPSYRAEHEKEARRMKKAIALALAAALLTGLAISAVLRQRTPRPERLTAQPTSREMVELVRTLRGKS